MPSKIGRSTVADLHHRLINLRTPRGTALGILYEGQILDVTATARALGAPAPSSIDDLIRGRGGDQVEAVLQRVREFPAEAVSTLLMHSNLAPPILNPEKIICIATENQRFASQAQNSYRTGSLRYHARFRNTLNHHNGVIILHPTIRQDFDLRVAFVAIIGAQCADIDGQRAATCIAGYTIGIDIRTSPDPARRSAPGSGLWSDGSAPMGPWLVPSNIVAHLGRIGFTCEINGLVQQHGATTDLVLRSHQLVAACSEVMTLRPGDLLCIDTGYGMLSDESERPLRVTLRPGDTVTARIENLGELSVSCILPTDATAHGKRL